MTTDDIFATSPYLLLHGRAQDILPTLPCIVDTVITSPPYWRHRVYDSDSGLGAEPTPDAYVISLCAVLNQLRRVTKPTASLWLNLGDTYRDGNLCGIPWRVALNLMDNGWNLHNAAIWHKTKCQPSGATRRLRPTYEFVFHLTPTTDYYYNIDAAREVPLNQVTNLRRGKRYRKYINDSTLLTDVQKKAATVALERAISDLTLGRIRDFRMTVLGQQRVLNGDTNTRSVALQRDGFYIQAYNASGPIPSDVWPIATANSATTSKHCATYPLELCRIPILATCPPNGVVLDPFVGTGTTVVAALALGRRAIGIDTSQEYLATALRRCSTETLDKLTLDVL